MSKLPDKVLRIGVVVDGRIAHERLIRPGTEVSVGESARNTFVIPPVEGLPRRNLIFPKRRGGWSLRWSPQMEGKLSRRRSIVPLDSLEGEARASDGGFVLPLDEHTRGKVQLHPRVSVLFQFVPAPPEAARIADASFKPRLVDEDDPVYLGFLGLFSAVAAVAMIWVWGQTPIERVGFEGIEDRFVHDVLVLQPVAPDPVEIEPVLQDDAPPEEAPEPDQAVIHDDAPPEPIYDDTQLTAAPTAEELVAQNPLIATLGNSTFDVSRNDIFDPKDESFDRMMAGLAYVEGEDFASAAGPGLRGCEGCETEDRELGEMGPKARTGPVRVHRGSILTDPSRDSIIEVDPPTGGGGPDVGGLLEAYDPHIRTCYEQGLNRSPTLRGRVELALGIDSGSTYGVEVLVNTTGDTKLTQCIEAKAQRWKFPAEVEADVVKNYVLTPME